MAKQKAFTHNWPESKDDILDRLTPGDVKALIKTCEELRVVSEFSRIFPTANTSKYLAFMEDEVSYYDQLLDSFMIYCRDRSFMDGVQLVRNMTLAHFPDGFLTGRRIQTDVVRRRQQRPPSQGSTAADAAAPDRRASWAKTQEVKARLLQARQTRNSSSAATETGREKRASILELGHLGRFERRNTCGKCPQLDRLTDSELRTFAAQRRVLGPNSWSRGTADDRDQLTRMRTVHVLLYGDFVLQSLDANFLQALGMRVKN